MGNKYLTSVVDDFYAKKREQAPAPSLFSNIRIFRISATRIWSPVAVGFACRRYRNPVTRRADTILIT
jgi:hypothetical protein